MRALKYLILIVAVIGCKDDSDPNPAQEKAWQQLQDFPKEGRSFGVGFCIGGNPFIGMAKDIDTVYNTFWKFDVNKNKWQQVSNPSTEAAAGLAFTINNKGYLLSNYTDMWPGFQGTGDFWQYDHATDSWTKKKSYSGEISMFGTSFTLNNKGYIFVGANFNMRGEKAGLWEYDPATDSWNEKAELPGGPARSMCAVFTIGGKAYIVGGVDHAHRVYRDVWVYDPGPNSWTRKNDFPGSARVGSFGFSIGNKGYVGAGSMDWKDTPEKIVKEFWAYDPVADKWQQLEDYPGEGLFKSIVISDGTYGYVLGGSFNKVRSRQFWRFKPTM